MSVTSMGPAIGKLHDYAMHYGTRLFMVSRKIKLHRNVLKIIAGAHFLSHNDYILPYISIKFRMVGGKSSGYTEVKTARESQQLIWNYSH